MDIYGLLFFKIPVLAAPLALFIFLIYGVRRELWDLKWECVALAIPLLWIFRSMLFNSGFPILSDLLGMISLQAGWKEGMLSLYDSPLWNGFTANGYPLNAHPGSCFFYPFNWIYLIPNTYLAISCSVALHYWLGAVFFVLFTREFKLSRFASFISGVAFIMNEWALGLVTSPAVTYQFASTWLPITLLYLIRFLRNENRFYSLSGLAIALSFSFIIFFNTFMYNFIIITIFFVIFILFNISKKIINDLSLWKGLALSIAIFSLLISVKLLPTGELLAISGEPRLSDPLLDSPHASRTRGMSLSELVDTFLGRKDIFFPAKFGSGKLIAIFMLLGILQYFNSKRHKEILFLLISLSVVLAFGIAIICKTQVYYLLRSTVPFFNRVTLMPSVQILLIFSISGLSALGVDMFLNICTKLAFRIRLLSPRISSNQLYYITGFAIAVIVTLWNLRFMSIPTYNYKKISNDFPHFSEVSDLMKNSIGRVAFYGNTAAYGQDPALIDYKINSFNCDYGRFTVKESYEIQNMNLEPAYSRFLSLAGVEYILSIFDLDKYELIKTVEWRNWDDHWGELSTEFPTPKTMSKGYPGKLLITKNNRWDKKVHIYKPRIPFLSRYRVYTSAILLVGTKVSNSNYALELMNSSKIDPLHTVILEIDRDDLYKIDQEIWKYVRLLVITDELPNTDSLLRKVPKDIYITKMSQLEINNIEFEEHSLMFDIPNIRSTNSYITIDTSNMPKGILFVGNTYYKGWKLRGSGQNRRAMKANYTFQGYLISKPGEFDIVFRHVNSYIGLLLSATGAAMVFLMTFVDCKRNYSKAESER